MVRFQRQPPGTAITRAALLLGAALAPAAAGAGSWRGEPARGGWVAALSAVLLLVGGHRANHGAGGPVDRAVTEFADRLWDGAILGAIVWTAAGDTAVGIGALVALVRELHLELRAGQGRVARVLGRGEPRHARHPVRARRRWG